MKKIHTRTTDKKMVGPGLWCETCGQNKVLSPCHSCQYFNKFKKQYCRGCGDSDCSKRLEVCKVAMEVPPSSPAYNNGWPRSWHYIST